MRRVAIVALAAVLLAPALPAQKASYTYFGRGSETPGFTGPARIVARNLPRLGQTFEVAFAGISVKDLKKGQHFGVAAGILLTGASRDYWGPFRLPFTWPAGYLGIIYIPKGFSLLTSSEVRIVTTAYDKNWRLIDNIRFRIPNASALLGVSFYQQWMLTTSRPTKASLVTSNAGHGVIGT